MVDHDLLAVYDSRRAVPVRNCCDRRCAGLHHQLTKPVDLAEVLNNARVQIKRYMGVRMLIIKPMDLGMDDRVVKRIAMAKRPARPDYSQYRIPGVVDRVSTLSASQGVRVTCSHYFPLTARM